MVIYYLYLPFFGTPVSILKLPNCQTEVLSICLKGRVTNYITFCGCKKYEAIEVKQVIDGILNKMLSDYILFQIIFQTLIQNI